MNDKEKPAAAATTTKAAPTYWLTRFVILRLLGFVYFFAFLSLARQVLPLIGSDGLLPATSFLRGAQTVLGSKTSAFISMPSIFWFGISDQMLVALSWTGVCLSLVVTLGFANSILMALLWALYMSFVHIGQDWYSYGWEIQILETGFLAIFLCPLLDARPFPKRAPPVVIIWLFRWLIFRIMLGAGLIKLRGDACWRDLTCMFYHYETQPIPNPLSRAFHFAPRWMLRFETLWNHLVELVAPWFVFNPRIARHIAGALLVSFQIILILSGNLSFLNYLTIVPALACFDDSLLARVLPKRLVLHAKNAAEKAQPSRAQNAAAICVACVVGLLSVAPTLNLLSGAQVMNGSFDPLNLVNTYGAFGSVGMERNEIIFEGTSDATISEKTVWKEYEFPCKPGNVLSRPCIVAPYQPRLDWAIWFAAMSEPAEYPWVFHFVWKLLHNDPGTLNLLDKNPFPDKPPRFIRAQLYRYHFAPPGNPQHAWWQRTLVGEWLPPLSIDDPDFRRVLAAQGWLKNADAAR